ncbi:HDIG domain-containing protein [Streptantibioticus ferralitis]
MIPRNARQDHCPCDPALPTLPGVGLEGWATHIAESQLAEALPRRWAHTQGVADRARSLEPVVGESADLLVAAAWLHDVGYAPPLAVTGFHPLDGARYLRDVHASHELLVRLVANHSYALLEAEERGLREDLEREFPLVDDPFLLDALVYCDMTTTPDGKRTSSEERIAEIVNRYGTDSVVGRFIRRAAPDIHASVTRVQARVDAA